MDGPRVERSLGELFSDLSQQMSALLRQEMLLARKEMADKMAGVGRDAAWAGIGAALGHTALLAATAAVVLLLMRLGLQAWVSAAIVAATLGIVAFVLVQGRLSALRRRDIRPMQTINSLKELSQWAKNELS
jgi:hypothetical protein